MVIAEGQTVLLSAEGSQVVATGPVTLLSVSLTEQLGTGWTGIALADADGHTILVLSAPAGGFSQWFGPVSAPNGVTVSCHEGEAAITLVMV